MTNEERIIQYMKIGLGIFAIALFMYYMAHRG